MTDFFASTAYGLEELLKNELIELGATDCQIVQGGLYFQGDDRLLYQSLLWSRLASRILLPLATFSIQRDQDLYLGAREIDWLNLFSIDNTFSVHFKGMNDAIRNTQYGALKVKDAVVDHFMKEHNDRPSVSTSRPDIRIHVFLQGDKANIALDFSGAQGFASTGISGSRRSSAIKRKPGRGNHNEVWLAKRHTFGGSDVRLGHITD